MKKTRRLNKKQHILLGVVAGCVILAAGGLAYGQIRKNQETITSGGNVQEIEETGTVTYQGKKYVYNKNLKNILFLGVDKSEEVQIQQFPGRGGQSDVLLLFAMDRKEKTTQILQISRDSMVNLKIYDIEGDLLTEERGQLALQYAYGDGEKKSCRLTRDAVSTLLYGVPVNGFASLNIDGVATIVDTIGGVPVTFSEDYSYVDPSYTQGASVVLDGAAAESFIRYRDVDALGSNNVRMERQTVFMRALTQALKGYVDAGGDYEILLDSVSPYMVSDLTAEEMKTLAEYQVQEPFLKVPGETVVGEKYDEYIVDDDALYEMILDVFYEEAKEQ